MTQNNHLCVHIYIFKKLFKRVVSHENILAT